MKPNDQLAQECIACIRTNNEAVRGGYDTQQTNEDIIKDYVERHKDDEPWSEDRKKEQE